MGGDNAVTGDEERERIGPAGRPNGSHRVGFFNGRRNLSVGAGLSVGNVLKRAPNLSLEFGAIWVFTG